MLRWLAVVAAGVVVACGSAPANGNAKAPSSVVVFAAASLQPPFDRIAAQLRTRDDIATTFNYAGTQTLTSQLTQGAQADVFASADTAHMTAAQQAGLLAGGSQLFAHNRLEIAVAKGNPKGIRSLADLARPGLVVVLADPAVPAGKYALQALAKAGVSVRPKSLELQVTAVLSKVALGEADAGIVYVSDVVTSGQVDGIAIPDGQNVIADYPIAQLQSAEHKEAAKEFIDFVVSPDGQSILKTAGFETA
ncbi:MAG TPA: molybdate ABC transporter substrate-binding protein [Candidatus Dormibacteraeota bacterium]|nr:molybdate ABC transporter substrate-binding protein [Candidatus Dormibacteraeota bacterium]